MPAFFLLRLVYWLFELLQDRIKFKGAQAKPANLFTG